MTNPYETLGVQKDATETEIKKAYRSLSLKHHPDRNQNSEDAKKKFQEINAPALTKLITDELLK